MWCADLSAYVDTGYWANNAAGYKSAPTAEQLQNLWVALDEDVKERTLLSGI
jgi:hypothetical protein